MEHIEWNCKVLSPLYSGPNKNRSSIRNKVKTALSYKKLKPLLQRNFISQLAERGMSELAKNILGYLDADSLRSAEQVNIFWRIKNFQKTQKF